MKSLHLVLLLLVLAMAVPFAAADTIVTFTLTNTNLTGVSNIGTVKLDQLTSGGVEVTLTANAGYSFKLGNGGGILFNTNGLVPSISSIVIDGKSYGGSFNLKTNQNRAGFGRFSYDLSGLTLKHGYVSATTISFFISNATLADFQPYKWGVHFCVGGGTGCGTGVTGFASNGSPSPVPEPGTLSLLGTGILGLAGFFRRRLFS
jgi:hypothetical protein